MPGTLGPSGAGPATSKSGGGADLRAQGLTWRPARRRTPVLSDLDLHIPAGQRVLLAGPSGAGKSTLLRALAGLLLTASHGDLVGRVLVDGGPVERSRDRPTLLLQDPRAGVVAESVGRDVAFGLENTGIPREQIWPRVRAALEAAGFVYPESHPTSALSGGESQRLALAGGLVLGSRVLLLDEPTSMLDPEAARTVQRAVRRYANAHRPTTVIVEHRLEPWLDFADRLVVLDQAGQIVADGDPRTTLAEQRDFLARQGVWAPGLAPPGLAPVAQDLVEPWEPGPRQLLSAEAVTLTLTSRLPGRGRSSTLALSEVDAAMTAGHALAVTGASGAGKSSLVTLLAGLRRPTSGRVVAAAELATRRGREPHRWRSRELAARLAWVPQSPEQGVVTRTVRDEVLAAAHACGRNGRRAERRADALLEVMGLGGLANASPYHLSGGEQRRLMVVAAVVHGPLGLLLDEPTVGQDRATWAAVLGVVAAARTAGTGVVMATHDSTAVDAIADDTLRLSSGRTVP